MSCLEYATKSNLYGFLVGTSVTHKMTYVTVRVITRNIKMRLTSMKIVEEKLSCFEKISANFLTAISVIIVRL